MTEKIYYKFIQFALGTYEGKEFLDGSALNGFDWQRFYAFAKKQTLVGIIMEGISRLPKAVAPKQGLLMNWFMMSQNIRRQNMMLNAATAEIYNKVKAAGYNCCILKGQANAAMYANPAARTPGDVDMWVNASREEIRQLAQTLTKENGRIDEESYNHIALTTNDISVELHYTPGFMANFTYNRRLQQWFRESIDAQCRNMIALPDEAGEVAASTADFNAVYQLYHLYHHYFYEGVGLRQVVDYYYVMWNVECGMWSEECGVKNSSLDNSSSQAKPRTNQHSTFNIQHSTFSKAPRLMALRRRNDVRAARGAGLARGEDDCADGQEARRDAAQRHPMRRQLRTSRRTPCLGPRHLRRQRLQAWRSWTQSAATASRPATAKILSVGGAERADIQAVALLLALEDEKV